jgi:lysine 2,3-aminomutase
LEEEPGGWCKSLRGAKPPFKVTKYLSRLIESEDGIKRQFVPRYEESEGYGEEDPLAESENIATPKAIHKYLNRLLIYSGNVCFSNCRYCVRRNLIKKRESIISDREVDKIIDYLNEHKEVNDVILSGGDPLVLKNSHLKWILTRLKSVETVKVLRIGSRAPIVQPKRITNQLVNMLSKFSPLYMNLHVNHPAELTEEVKVACDLLVKSGVLLGSQTVLLKNVNDNKDTMLQLMEKLLSFRIKPYYLYICDHVNGTKHFWTTEAIGTEIIEHLRKNTSGLAVPTLVRDTKERKVTLA